MAQKYYVEWGGSKVFEYKTTVYDRVSGKYIEVDPDEIRAAIETAEVQPVHIADTLVERVDTGTFYVLFSADKNLVESGKAYYLAVYWKYGVVNMVERVLIVVVPDVPATTLDYKR